MSRQIGHDLIEKVRTEDIHILENVSFSELVTQDAILQGLHSSGFKTPSPIQLKAIPIGRVGFDMVMQAKSGTGKTVVFTVLALEQIDLKNNSVQVLIIVPTREIALQITDVITHIGRKMKGLKVKTFIGGTSFTEDKRSAQKCHIAVGAPGRLKHLVETKHLQTSEIRLFVLDEADKLLEPDFQKSINYIFNTLPASKQIIASSATYPKELQEFLTLYMRSPIHVSPDPQASVVLLGLRQFISVVKYSPSVAIQMQTKIEELFRLLKFINFRQCLIFSNYHLRAESICTRLSCNGWPAVWISSKMDQKSRNEAIESLREFRCRVLLSTDLTARGIDIENVNLVINLDVPYNSSTYLHRIGRAGRYGSHGIVIQMVAEGEELQTFRKILGLIGGVEQCAMKLPSDVLPKDLWSTDDSFFEKIVGITHTSEEKLLSSYKFEVDEFMKSSKIEQNENVNNGEINCTNPMKHNALKHTNNESDQKVLPSTLSLVSNCQNISAEIPKDVINQVEKCSHLQHSNGVHIKTRTHLDTQDIPETEVMAHETPLYDDLKRKELLGNNENELNGLVCNLRDVHIKHNDDIVSDITKTLFRLKEFSKLDSYKQLHDSLIDFNQQTNPVDKCSKPKPVNHVSIERYRHLYDTLEAECQSIIQDMHEKALNIKTGNVLAHLITDESFSPDCNITLQDNKKVKAKKCRKKKNKVHNGISKTEHSAVSSSNTSSVSNLKLPENELSMLGVHGDSSAIECAAVNEQTELRLDNSKLINSLTSANAENSLERHIHLTWSNSEHTNCSRENKVKGFLPSLMASEHTEMLENASSTGTSEKMMNCSVPNKSSGCPNSRAVTTKRSGTRKKHERSSFSQSIFDRKKDCRNTVHHTSSNNSTGSDTDKYQDNTIENKSKESECDERELYKLSYSCGQVPFSKMPRPQMVSHSSFARGFQSAGVTGNSSSRVSNQSSYPFDRDGFVPTQRLSSQGSVLKETKSKHNLKFHQSQQNNHFVTSQIPHSCEFHNPNIGSNKEFRSQNLNHGSRKMKSQENIRHLSESSCNHGPQCSSNCHEPYRQSMSGWQSYLSEDKRYKMWKAQAAHLNFYYNEYWKCMLHKK